jgi:hypothetical protein
MGIALPYLTQQQIERYCLPLRTHAFVKNDRVEKVYIWRNQDTTEGKAEEKKKE